MSKPRPRFWEEWEALSRTTDKAVVVYEANRLKHVAHYRDTYCFTDGWPNGSFTYYHRGVRYYVHVTWHEATIYESYPSTRTVPWEKVPRNVKRVVAGIRAVLGAKITQADRDRLAEEKAFAAKVLAWTESYQPGEPSHA